jgi:hypothetical protein
LHASASYAFDPAAAEQYLDPALRKTWRPASGSVAVVGAPTAISAARLYRAQLQGALGLGTQLETVKFTGQRLATLSPTGQYQYTPGQTEYQFILAKTDGVWLINELPQGQPGLLLTQSDFESVYQPRNLFFYAPGASVPVGVLVPDPVYAPLQSSNSALNTNLATGLVNGLLNGPRDWLSGATSSAFPAGSSLLKQVTITGKVAQVDLGGAAVHATDQQIELMEAQLKATLGDRSYAEPLANQVQLYFNNKLQYPWSAANDNLVPPVPTGPIMVITGPSSVGQLPDRPRDHTAPVVRVSPAQIGGATVTAVAADPTGGRTPQIAVAVADQKGCAVFLATGGPASYHPFVLSTSGGTCTSLSWDSNGNVWATAGQAVWVLPPQNRRPVAVDVSKLAAIGQPGSSVLALQIAPDNVRAALLVHTRSGNKLLLAAVRFDHHAVAFGMPVSIGAGDAVPIAVSWSDAYHLAVLATSAGGAAAGGSLIFSIPLTGGAGLQPGGAPQSLGPAPDGAQTLTTDGSELVVGTTDGHTNRIFASSPSFAAWSLVTTGSDPVYPG